MGARSTSWKASIQNPVENRGGRLNPAGHEFTYTFEPDFDVEYTEHGKKHFEGVRAQPPLEREDFTFRFYGDVTAEDPPSFWGYMSNPNPLPVDEVVHETESNVHERVTFGTNMAISNGVLEVEINDLTAFSPEELETVVEAALDWMEDVLTKAVTLFIERNRNIRFTQNGQ